MRPAELSAQFRLGCGCGEAGGKEVGRYFRSQAAHNESWPAAGGGHGDTEHRRDTESRGDTELRSDTKSVGSDMAEIDRR